MPFENPGLYWLINTASFAAAWFGISAISGVRMDNLIGALIAGLVFGGIMTFAVRRINGPPTP